jgi:hypothetical protein
MQISKANFALAKTAKSLVDEESPFFALHITGSHTEITNGAFAVRMRHSAQNEFEFAPEALLSVCLHPEDAANIASSLGKDDGIKGILPADDGETVQVEFESGEIRILKPINTKFPDISTEQPSGSPSFSIAIDPEMLIAVLQAFKAKEVGSVLMEYRGSEKVISLRPAAALNPSDPEVTALLCPQRAEVTVELPGVTREAKHTAQGETTGGTGIHLQ